MNKRMFETNGHTTDMASYDAWMMGRGGGMTAARQFAEAINNKQAIYCCLEHGQRTLLSSHLYRCLCTVCRERELTPPAAKLQAWLSSHEGSTATELRRAGGLTKSAFDKAFLELQQRTAVLPIRVLSVHPQTLEPEVLWVTDGFWRAVAPRPAQYQDISYCLAEIYRLMPPTFAAEEIGRALYSCA